MPKTALSDAQIASYIEGIKVGTTKIVDEIPGKEIANYACISCLKTASIDSIVFEHTDTKYKPQDKGYSVMHPSCWDYIESLYRFNN